MKSLVQFWWQCWKALTGIVFNMFNTFVQMHSSKKTFLGLERKTLQELRSAESECWVGDAFLGQKFSYGDGRLN